MQRLTAAFHAVDMQHPSVTWVERVPSESNPSDAPSRGKSAECAKTLGGLCVGKIGVPAEMHHAIKSSSVRATSPGLAA